MAFFYELTNSTSIRLGIAFYLVTAVVLGTAIMAIGGGCLATLIAKLMIEVTRDRIK